jgi:hypothetical protein
MLVTVHVVTALHGASPAAYTALPSPGAMVPRLLRLGMSICTLHAPYSGVAVTIRRAA